MVRGLAAAGLAIFLPVLAQAQGHGMAAPMARGAAGGPRIAVQANYAAAMQVRPGVAIGSSSVRMRPVNPSVRIVRRSGVNRRRFDIGDRAFVSNCNSAPGLGFDAVHQAAICGSNSFGGRRHGFQVPLFFPFFDGGFALPSAPVVVDEGPDAETQQSEAIDTEAAESHRRHRVTQSIPEAPAEVASPDTRESEQFVFVRRDGTLFFAVAYAWENGTLRYVTNEGLRRTVSQSALDLDATQQFNEQRGLNFRSPA